MAKRRRVKELKRPVERKKCHSWLPVGMMVPIVGMMVVVAAWSYGRGDHVALESCQNKGVRMVACGGDV